MQEVAIFFFFLCLFCFIRIKYEDFIYDAEKVTYTVPATMTASSVSSRTSSARPKKYLCDHEGCTKAYSKPSLLEQHKRSHTGDRPFKCPIPGCESSFLRNGHLTAHLVSHESSEDKPFCCSICNKGVNSRQHLKRHEKTHSKSFVCQYKDCNEAFYRHPTLRHHVLSVHKKTLTCLKCDKTFVKHARLAQHTIKFHGDSPAYQCDFQGCFGNFKTWSALQLHVKTDHPKLKCPICDKGCVGKKGLKSHMNSHDEDKMIKLWHCDYCDAGKYLKKAGLIKHYHEYHDGNIPSNLLKPKEKKHLEDLYNENDLTVNADNLQALERNVFQQVSSDDEVENVSTEEPKRSQSIDSFTSTMQSGKTSIIDMISSNYQHKKISCPKRYCDRKFAKQYDLDRHLSWHVSHLKKIDAFLLSLENEEKELTLSNKRSIGDLADSENGDEAKRAKAFKQEVIVISDGSDSDGSDSDGSDIDDSDSERDHDTGRRNLKLKKENKTGIKQETTDFDRNHADNDMLNHEDETVTIKQEESSFSDEDVYAKEDECFMNEDDDYNSETSVNDNDFNDDDNVNDNENNDDDLDKLIDLELEVLYNKPT